MANFPGPLVILTLIFEYSTFNELKRQNDLTEKSEELIIFLSVELVELTFKISKRNKINTITEYTAVICINKEWFPKWNKTWYEQLSSENTLQENWKKWRGKFLFKYQTFTIYGHKNNNLNKTVNQITIQ